MGQDILLQMTDICKEFPGVKALDNVSLTVKKGTVHALMGENGAGKSTLMKCLFGIYNMDSGKILLDGKEVNFKKYEDMFALYLESIDKYVMDSIYHKVKMIPQRYLKEMHYQILYSRSFKRNTIY